MSWLRGPLNAWLRAVEKPALRRGTPDRVRRRFEVIARLFFHGPRDVGSEWTQFAGHEALVLTPPKRAGEPVLLFFHGGGFVFGSPKTHEAMLAWLAKETGLRAILPRYRLAPEHPFPAAVDDAMAVYRALSEKAPVIIGGDSAGGALALTVLAEALREGLRTPRGVFALSPLTDLTFSGESLARNARTEAVLPADRAPDLVAMYLGDQAPEDPRASPLFADFTGAPPVWLCVSTQEILLDDTRRMAASLGDQGVEVTERIEEGLPHVWPIFHNTLPEARGTLLDLAGWITSRAPSSGES